MENLCLFHQLYPMAINLYQVLYFRIVSEHGILGNDGQIYHQLGVGLKCLRQILIIYIIQILHPVADGIYELEI